MLKANDIRMGLSTTVEAVSDIGRVMADPHFAPQPEDAAVLLIPPGEERTRGWYFKFDAFESAPLYKDGQGLYTFKCYGLRAFSDTSAVDLLTDGARIFEALVASSNVGVSGAYLVGFRVDRADEVFQSDTGEVNLFDASVLVEWGMSC